ncbi:MAG: acyclic terpene utilization AtuA family protein [Alphaproteobacteria bacterium]|nr:acyclic terpene utilization AtuA family protein [Alphaproteobacteria bacterium]
MARIGHAGRGGRPDHTARLLEILAAHQTSACLAVRLSGEEADRALSGILIDCLSKRIRLAVEVIDGDVAAVANSIVGMAARLARRRPRVGLLQSRDILATQQGVRLLAVPCDPPAPAGSALVAALAPLGAEPLLGLFARGAEVIVTGPLATSALAVAFARHEHRWPADAYQNLAAAAMAGRVICGGAASLSGALDDIDAASGLPFVDIGPDGAVSLGSSGTAPSTESLALALLDGVRDPGAIIEPDVTVDLSTLSLLGLAMSGVAGRAPVDWLAGTLTFESGFNAEAEIAFGGSGAAGRAIAAARALERRLSGVLKDERFRVEVVGVDSITRSATEHAGDLPIVPGRDVRLRLVARTANQELARAALAEFESMVEQAPGGAGGMRKSMTRARHLSTAQIPRALAPWSATPPADP